MPFHSATLALLLATASTTLAYTATVANHCPYPIYVQPSSGQPTQLAATTGVYTEAFRPAAAVYLADTPAHLAAPLTLEYNTWTDGAGAPVMSYDLSNNAGNPFAGVRNTLSVVGNAACAHVDCAAGDAACYSNGASPKVLSCAPGDLEVVVCA